MWGWGGNSQQGQRSSLGIPGWGLGRLLTPPVIYKQEEEEEEEEEEEVRMVLNGKNEEQSQKQREANTVNYRENVKDMGREEDESAVTGSREVLEDDVLTWWNEALASQDSVQASQDSVLTVLQLGAGDEHEQAVGIAEDRVQFELGLKEHEQREDLEKSVEKEQGHFSHMTLNGNINEEEEEKTQRRDDSQTPTGGTVLKEETEAKRNEAEQKGPIPTSDSWDTTTGVTDSQLLAMLASKHCYQCTSTSTLDWTDYEEGEEEYNEEGYEEEMGEVVSASLHIPMYSPVRACPTFERRQRMYYLSSSHPRPLHLRGHLAACRCNSDLLHLKHGNPTIPRAPYETAVLP